MIKHAAYEDKDQNQGMVCKPDDVIPVKITDVDCPDCIAILKEKGFWT